MAHLDGLDALRAGAVAAKEHQVPLPLHADLAPEVLLPLVQLLGQFGVRRRRPRGGSGFARRSFMHLRKKQAKFEVNGRGEFPFNKCGIDVLQRSAFLLAPRAEQISRFLTRGLPKSYDQMVITSGKIPTSYWSTIYNWLETSQKLSKESTIIRGSKSTFSTMGALHSRHFFMREAQLAHATRWLQGRNSTGASVCCEHTRHSTIDRFDTAVEASSGAAATATSEFRAALAALSSGLAPTPLAMNSSCKIALDAGSWRRQNGSQLFYIL